MIEVVYRCDKCRGTVISHHRYESRYMARVFCADCGQEESIKFEDYCSPHNKMLLEILSVLEGK